MSNVRRPTAAQVLQIVEARVPECADPDDADGQEVLALVLHRWAKTQCEPPPWIHRVAAFANGDGRHAQIYAAARKAMQDGPETWKWLKPKPLRRIDDVPEVAPPKRSAQVAEAVTAQTVPDGVPVCSDGAPLVPGRRYYTAYAPSPVWCYGVQLVAPLVSATTATAKSWLADYRPTPGQLRKIERDRPTPADVLHLLDAAGGCDTASQLVDLSTRLPPRPAGWEYVVEGRRSINGRPARIVDDQPMRWMRGSDLVSTYNRSDKQETSDE